jgi:hypothetical protein
LQFFCRWHGSPSKCDHPLKWWARHEWCTPKLLNRLKCEYKMKTSEEQNVEANSLAHNTLGVEGRDGALGWD